jgi:immunoglobulin-like protein involved in spore germination/sporulation and spore germination protein
MPMSGRILTAFSLIVLALGLAGCGGDDGETTTFDTDTTITTTDETTTTTTTTTTSEETTKLRVYFLLDGKVQPVAREVPKTVAVARAALDELAEGPTKSERELGLTSDAATPISTVVIENGVAKISGDVSSAGLAQVVYTLTQFPTVKRVKIDSKQYTRKSMEDYTPAILVESPLPFETVGNPLRARGTANTFEANFEYEVVEPEGRIVDSHFVTATSGTGTRGTFDFRSRPYEISREGLGALIVFERSAKDGSRINLVEIPVQMNR